MLQHEENGRMLVRPRSREPAVHMVLSDEPEDGAEQPRTAQGVGDVGVRLDHDFSTDFNSSFHSSPSTDEFLALDQKPGRADT
jgi:hypothetical protein